MNISTRFVDRPIFAAVLSILVFIAGVIAIFKLPISEYPEVVPPSVVVRAQFPGANPKVIAETVSAPLEEQINGVENMLYMSSQATTDGVMTEIDSPSKLPETTRIEKIEEPVITATILTPQAHVGGILELCQEKRGIQKNLE